MKTEVHYICGICGYKSLNKKEVKECEAEGIPDISKYPIGLIYNNPKKGEFFENMTFAIATIRVYHHSLDAGLYACRDNCAGDTLKKDSLCGGSDSFSLGEYDIPDKEHPTFKRMVKALRKKKIPITIWDGEKAVPYKV